MKRKSNPSTIKQPTSPDKTHVMRAAASSASLASGGGRKLARSAASAFSHEKRSASFSREPLEGTASSASLASGNSRDKAPEQSVGSVSAAHGQGGFFAFAKPTVFALLLFFAMTVQTAPMALILGVLAFLSLLGKKPLLRFRQRLSVPVLGLLCFAVVYGAAAIYSPFGETAMAEFYKFLAAFSLAVILLARYDREDVPGVLWGGASVSAAIALISLDMSCGQVIFGVFNPLVSALGADFSNALPEYINARVNGLYNDANVTACLFALAVFTSLYLLRNTDRLWKRFAAAMLAGVNAVSLLLTGSRGALLCFAVACLVWLLLERLDRMGLLILLVETAVAMAAAGVPASAMVSQGAEMAVPVCLLGGVVLFGLDALLGRRLAPVLSAHKKAAAAAVGVLCVAVAALGAAVFLHTGPYTFETDGASVTYLLPNGTAGEVVLTGDADDDFEVLVYSQTQLERYHIASTTLYSGPLSQCAFTVPEDAAEVHVRLTGNAGQTLRSLTLNDGQSITLRYPWLPDAIASRLLNDRLFGGNSSFMREEYVRDSLTLFTQEPVQGYGLGSTENLYRSVQRFAYASKYAHNHLLQTMTDTGAVGTAFALCFVLGAAWLCLKAIRKDRDSLAAALLAAWVMMNLHSLMEISFSVRGFKCFAYMLLVLPVLLWAERPAGETAQVRKRTKKAGILVALLYTLYLAAFGGLLESARMVDKQAAEFQTSDVTEYLSTLQGYVRRNVFDHDYYARSYVATAVQLNDPRWNGAMLKYANELRASGTYENDSALARYYYMPREKWDDVFACSLEGIHQVRSSSDGWNYQMDFYRTELLPAMGADNMDAYLSGVLELGDALDAMNAEGRMEEVSLNEENQAFLNLCRSAVEQGLSGPDAYAVLSLAAGASGEDAQ